MVRAWLKTGKVLRQLSGVEKYGRKLGTDRPSLYNDPRVGSFRQAHSSDPLMTGSTPERPTQDLTEAGRVPWAPSNISREMFSSRLELPKLAELAAGPPGTESLPASPVSSARTSPTLVELPSPWNGNTDHSSVKSNNSTARTSVPTRPLRDLGATPKDSKLAKYPWIEPPSYDDETSWLLDDEDASAPCRDANNIRYPKPASHLGSHGKNNPRDAQVVVPENAQDARWPTHTTDHRPAALQICMISVAAAQSGETRPLEISHNGVHLHISR